jgi:hypothetical protein
MPTRCRSSSANCMRACIAGQNVMTPTQCLFGNPPPQSHWHNDTTVKSCYLMPLQCSAVQYTCRTCSSCCVSPAASALVSRYLSKCCVLASSAPDNWLLLDCRRHSNSVTCRHRKFDRPAAEWVGQRCGKLRWHGAMTRRVLDTHLLARLNGTSLNLLV